MASRSASAEDRRFLQPSALIFEQSKRTTGTSPFQPRSPPVKSYLTFPWSKPRDPHRQIRDLPHSNVIIRGNVENFVSAVAYPPHKKDRFEHVIDVDIAFLLSAISEDAQRRCIVLQSCG